LTRTPIHQVSSKLDDKIWTDLWTYMQTNGQTFGAFLKVKKSSRNGYIWIRRQLLHMYFTADW